MENELPTALTGQSTHEELVKKSGLQRILFHKSFLRRILFHAKSGLRRIFFHKKSFSESLGDAFHLKFFILSTNSLVVKMIRTPILSDHNETICSKQ